MDSKGSNHDPFVGLQAAGWVAYEYYLDAHRLLYAGPSDRWAFHQFESIPGNIIVLHHTLLMPHVPSMEKYMTEKCNAVRDAALWLEGIKAAGVAIRRRVIGESEYDSDSTSTSR